ncbi:EamA family transporter [Alkalihalobacillus hwajinpoensis]|uniref:DMT family transporter n=1 Tax=Guptibacillus hwajinpoensis TaxID=208199 RepID=UPI001883F2A0|nr:EamA family transporter [Pseudalkalibacillus hwajinpoensis]MBF0705818.1 EamA family transporter [Pseudalkalibacillus hwajinpoensis]
MKLQNRHVGLMMISSGAALWGVSGPMIQWLFLHSNISSIDFLVFRLLLAGTFLLLFLSCSKKQIFEIWKFKGHRLQLILFGTLGMLGAQYFFIETIHVSNAVTAMLFQFLAPTLITFYVAIQIKKLPTLRQLIAIGMALIGLFFLITNGSYNTILLSKEAISFGILTMLGFTFYTVQPVSLIKRWGVLLVVGWGMLIAGVLSFLLNLDFSIKVLTDDLTVNTSVMLVGIIASGTLSFLLYIGSLNYLSPSETSILSSIEPLVAVIISVTWLNESFGYIQLAGGLCIIVAVVILTTPARNKKRGQKKRRASQSISTKQHENDYS